MILNPEVALNTPLQICAFLSAVKLFPALIICPEDDVADWYQEFVSKTSFETQVLEFPDDVAESKEIIIVSHKVIRRLQHLKNVQWGSVIIDCIESVIKAALIKKFFTKFRIGITNYNFVVSSLKVYFVRREIFFCEN